MNSKVSGFFAHLLIYASAFAELYISNEYFQVSSEVANISKLFAFAIIIATASYFCVRRLTAAMQAHVDRMLYAATVAGGIVTLGMATGSAVLFGWNVPKRYLVAVLLGGGLAWCLTVSRERWIRVRLGASMFFVFFVFSQPALAMFFGNNRTYWMPVTHDDREDSAGSAKSVVMFLLLDELSASQTLPIEQVLKAQALSYVKKSIATVGRKTSEVIPALFSQHDFQKAKPCGLTTMCSGQYAFNFRYVVAARPDIDIVGFYHPYCAIAGLRSCALISKPNPFLNAEGWDCALTYVAKEFDAYSQDRCQKRNLLLPQFVDAILRANTWDLGGVLYAHVPLPHPPGVDRSSDLRTDYEDNLRKAAHLVQGIINRAKSSGIEKLQLVIFSDHPLRPELWCKHERYQEHGCEDAQTLMDDKVPLIVTGYGGALPDISNINSNQQIFSLNVQ